MKRRASAVRDKIISQPEVSRSWLSNVLIPLSVIQDRERFGGTPDGECLRGRAVIQGGRIVRLDPADETKPKKIVLPRLVEPHCHLDKCHSIHRMGVVGGDLAAAIARQMNDKRNWTQEDLRTRMLRGLSEARAAGCGTLRTHIDWSDASDAPRAWQVIRELATDTPDMTLQHAALMGIDQLADAAFCDEVARSVARSNGVLGAFVLHHSEIEAGLRNIFVAAERYGLALDFHVDEGHGPFNGLEQIANTALDVWFQGPILCGHAVSLMDRTGSDIARIADKLHRAGIAVCALPTTNLYLQGRTTGTPDRRGITRLRELRTAGVPVLIGSDNVGDAFCPLGAHDPMAALHLACLAGHLDPPLGRWLPAITTDAARAMGLDPVTVDGARLQDLVMSDAGHLPDLISGRAPLVPLSNPSEETIT